MKVKVLSEHGYEEAMLGVSLSWASSPERSSVIAPNLAHKQGGHNKFTESMIIWADVTAPRYWWQEADTYRVGTTKQSESTMHTISKRHLTQEDFEYPILESYLEELNDAIDWFKCPKCSDKEYFYYIKNNLPEGFLQRRVWMFSYKTLQNMYHQRINHKLPQWKYFLETVLDEIEHPEFIVKGYEK